KLKAGPACTYTGKEIHVYSTYNNSNVQRRLRPSPWHGRSMCGLGPDICLRGRRALPAVDMILPTGSAPLEALAAAHRQPGSGNIFPDKITVSVRRGSNKWLRSSSRETRRFL